MPLTEKQNLLKPKHGCFGLNKIGTEVCNFFRIVICFKYFKSSKLFYVYASEMEVTCLARHSDSTDSSLK